MRKLIIIVSILILCCIAVISVWWILETRNPYRNKQEKLAKELGVRIEDFPYEAAFPEGYFDAILHNGMTVSQVHNVVKGYTQVFHCETRSEIYYYFSLDDAKALRIEIYYDEKLKYKYLTGEDEDSRTIRLDGCSIGLIEENGSP